MPPKYRIAIKRGRKKFIEDPRRKAEEGLKTANLTDGNFVLFFDKESRRRTGTEGGGPDRNA
jgi:hypothetical protein